MQQDNPVSPFAQDSIWIADLALCELRLYDQSKLLWLLLVPKIAAKVELIDLSFADQINLLKEINFISRLIKGNFPCDKLNIATLGNVTPVLHIHVIARRYDDPYFPNAPFGMTPQAYTLIERDTLVKKIQELIRETPACA